MFKLGPTKTTYMSKHVAEFITISNLVIKQDVALL